MAGIHAISGLVAIATGVFGYIYMNRLELWVLTLAGFVLVLYSVKY